MLRGLAPLIGAIAPSPSLFDAVGFNQRCSDHGNRLTAGNRSGWPLPTIPELTRLFDPTQSRPALPVRGDRVRIVNDAIDRRHPQARMQRPS